MTNLSTLLTNGILTNQVTHDNLNGYTSTKFQQDMPLPYDVDSYLIGIDNHASASMSNNPNDFVGTLRNSNNTISGIKGHLNTVKIGTVRWHIQDDDGKAHRFDLRNTYLVPDLPIRLLSPQHLAREMTQKHGDVDNTVCITYADRVILSWKGCKYKRTIPLNSSNVPVIRSAPGYQSYQNTTDDTHEVAFRAGMIKTISEGSPTILAYNAPLNESEDDEIPKIGVKTELFLWHVRLGHMSFNRLLQKIGRAHV